MKRSLLTLGLVSIIGVTACGGDTVYVTATSPDTEAPAVETTVKVVTAPSPTRPPSSYTGAPTSGYDESAFFAGVIANAPTIYAVMPNADILDMGLLICEQFDLGLTLDEVTEMVVTSMANSGTMSFASEIAAVQASAMLFLCPEYAFWLDTI